MNTSQSELNSEVLISVITVCFNSARTITDTFCSIREQLDSRIEYIVVDGGSTDGTIEIILEYLDTIDHWISEADEGIYDAMNKGVRLSHGRYLLFLNSDDYLHGGAIMRILDTLQIQGRPVNCILSGITRIVNANKTEVTRLTLNASRFGNRYKFNPFPHPSSIVSRDVFAETHGFNCEYEIAADYDFFLRALLLNPNIILIDAVISNMRMGGSSDEYGPFRQILRHQIELCKIQSQYVSPFFAAYYLISRLVKLTAKRSIKRWRILG